MKAIKILFFLLVVAALSSCRAHCGCPMASAEQKNTISPQEQTDGDLDSIEPTEHFRNQI